MREWLACAFVVLVACGTHAPVAHARAKPRGTATPHLLPSPGAVAAHNQPTTWLVGARPGPATRTIAARNKARQLSPRGTYLVTRARARAFVGRLRAAGIYRFAEPNRRVVAQQAPAGGDDFAATDWRAFLLDPALVPPPAATAPLIAVIDSAVDTTHPDLAGVQVTGDPTVSDLHGTAVASVAAGRANGYGMVGMFPGAPVLSVGSGLSEAELVQAIATSVDAGARIINLSLGGPVPSYAIFVEIAYAVSQDVLVVASAGNDYLSVLPDGTENPVMYPAAFPHVMSVSSVGPSGASSSFSTANGAVDVAAPGESVLAAVPVALDDDGTPDGFERLDGTSFSAPIVSGAASWLLARRPGLSATQAADLLRVTATDVAPSGWDVDTGFGLIELGAALVERAPQQDTVEVNDDIEWVNGQRFTRPDTPVFRARQRKRRLEATVDLWKDPADVYRVQLPSRRRWLEIVLGMPRDANADLAVFNDRGRSIYRGRGLMATSYRRAGRTDRAYVRSRTRRPQTAYVVVYGPTEKDTRIDAPYSLTVRRLR
jgi:Subtilase family